MDVPDPVVYAAIAIFAAQSVWIGVDMTARALERFDRRKKARRAEPAAETQKQAGRKESKLDPSQLPTTAAKTREEFLEMNFETDEERNSFASDPANKELLQTLPSAADGPKADSAVHTIPDKRKLGVPAIEEIWVCSCGEKVPSSRWNMHVLAHGKDGKGSHVKVGTEVSDANGVPAGPRA